MYGRQAIGETANPLLLDVQDKQRESEEKDLYSLMRYTACLLLLTHASLHLIAVARGYPIVAVLHFSSALLAMGFVWIMRKGVSLSTVRRVGTVCILAGMAVFCFSTPGPLVLFVYVVSPGPLFRVLGRREGSWAVLVVLLIASLCLVSEEASRLIGPLVRLNTGIAFLIATFFGFFFERSREKAAESLALSLAELRVLKGFVPICCVCKKVRDKNDHWRQIEEVLRSPGETEFSHTYCDRCLPS